VKRDETRHRWDSELEQMNEGKGVVDTSTYSVVFHKRESDSAACDRRQKNDQVAVDELCF
jgi:hypothetical protein